MKDNLDFGILAVGWLILAVGLVGWLAFPGLAVLGAVTLVLAFLL